VLVHNVETGSIYPVFPNHRFGKGFKEFIFSFPPDANRGSFKERKELFAIDIVELEKIIVDNKAARVINQDKPGLTGKPYVLIADAYGQEIL
jgi:hypothetical protein